MAGDSDKYIQGELVSEERIARMHVAGVRMNILKVMFDYSRHELMTFIGKMIAHDNSGGIGDQNFSMYVNVYNDKRQESVIPDEFFMAEGYDDCPPPEKKIWTREQLQSDFPAGSEPCFKVIRYKWFKDGLYTDTHFSYEKEFGWEDYE